MSSRLGSSGPAASTVYDDLLSHCLEYLELLETLPFSLTEKVTPIIALRDSIAAAERGAAI
jgi:hypothetical protein